MLKPTFFAIQMIKSIGLSPNGDTKIMVCIKLRAFLIKKVLTEIVWIGHSFSYHMIAMCIAALFCLLNPQCVLLNTEFKDWRFDKYILFWIYIPHLTETFVKRQINASTTLNPVARLKGWLQLNIHSRSNVPVDLLYWLLNVTACIQLNYVKQQNKKNILFPSM